MAILIPSMGACVARTTSGERRVGERLQAKLDADYLVLHGDGIPLLKPVSCGREGQEPLIIKLPTLQAVAEAIADHLVQAHKEGFAWGDMAVLCADTQTRDLCARTLAQRKLPVENRLGSVDFDPTSNKIKVMTMKVSKGLEFPVVTLPGLGHMPAAGEDEKEAARVFYVAATRATHKLVATVSGSSIFGRRLQHLPSQIHK
ncbi:MAG: ATP-binding domain-containing protein [Burkholderiales bacterium]|nr:ATP-binding domain-containing protein [Burkholderiales bacterium]